MRKHKAVAIFVCICAVACVLLLGGIYLNSFSPSSGVKIDTNAETASSTSDNEQPMINFPVYGDVTIDSTDTSIPIQLLNPEGNPCYFTFDVSLEGSDALAYTTDQVEPGHAINAVPLDKPLAAGDYTMDIGIATTSLEDQSQMNGVTVKVALHVQDSGTSQ